VGGPVFISVGQPEQLRKFLDLNPEISPSSALVDSSESFDGYASAGFNVMIGDKTLSSPPEFKPPKTMGGGRWISYLANTASLAPIPKSGLRFGQIPPGVKVLGGTYAVDGDGVVFSHMDEVPGATPEIEAVLAAVGA